MASTEPEDRDDLEVCNLCGAPVAGEPGRAFGFGTENVLCWGCASARGGRYDAVRDRWDVAPDLSDLRDEAYGAAPHEVQRRRP